MVRVMTVLGVLLAIASGQTERWVYSYNGPRNFLDEAYSLVAAADGNIYAAGYSYGSGNNSDFTVISLTSSGSERWVYRYNGPENDEDVARSLVAGADGNIYAAGYSYGSGTGFDFTVISLTSSGTERWVYRYNGPGNTTDGANSIVAGADGNIYAAGSSNGTFEDFTVISLTSSGSERWVYRYNGPGNYDDGAYSIVAAADGNIYAAGCSWGGGTDYDFTVISLTSLGAERRVYRYNGSRNSGDVAYSIVAGADTNVYAAGYSSGNGTFEDFTVISLTSLGAERWVYRYNGSRNSGDVAYSIVAGADTNVYAAGYSSGSGTSSDFTVISLNPAPGIAEGNSRPAGNAFGLAVGTILNHALAYTLKLPEPATVSLLLCDLQGRKLSSWQVPAPKGTSQHMRNLSRGHDAESCPLPFGVYFLNAEVPGKELRASRKLISVK